MRRSAAAFCIVLLTVIFLFVFVQSDQSAGRDNTAEYKSASITPTPELPTPTPTSLPQPVRLAIPKLSLDVAIESKGANADGHMDTPSWETVAWFNLGPRPGEEGSAVIAGHYDTNTGAPSTFYNLSNLEPGDEVLVVDEYNNTLRFTVIDKRTYETHTFPIHEVFNDPLGKKLNLITCSGIWDPVRSTYTDRLVVYTQLQ